MQDEVCAASGAQTPCAEPETVVDDGRLPLLERVSSKEDTMSACTCDEAQIEVHADDHDELDEREKNGGGVDDGGDSGGTIAGPSLLSYWTRSLLAVGTGPRSTFWDWHSAFSRDRHGVHNETVSETGHVTVSGRAGVSSSIRGGPDATVFLGCMMGFVDMTYL